MDHHLNQIICCYVFEKMAVNFGNREAYKAIIGVNFAATQYSKMTVSFLLCFLSKPFGRGSVLCVFQPYFSVFLSGVLLVCDLSQ